MVYDLPDLGTLACLGLLVVGTHKTKRHACMCLKTFENSKIPVLIQCIYEMLFAGEM